MSITIFSYAQKQYFVCIYLITIISLRRTGARLAEENPGPGIFEGDILLTQDEIESMESGEASAGILGDHYRWPAGVIPYELASVYEPWEIKNLLGAMKEISDQTCIRFVNRTNEKNYVKIQAGQGCSADVGMRGNGPQNLNLNNNNCFVHGTILHELMHTIGFYHEQSRIDRDDYVTVLYQNIEPGKVENFRKYTSGDVNDYGIRYDYSSLLHYHSFSFIKRGVSSTDMTIIPKQPGVKIGQRNHLSLLDTVKIVRMYCSDKEGHYRTLWFRNLRPKHASLTY